MPPPPSSLGLNPGALLHGRYRLERLAGRGATAEVWRAFDQHQDRTVALRLLQTARAAAPAERAQARHVVSLLTAVEHPNVVRVLEFDDRSLTQLLVMEWVDGSPLSERLGGEPLTETRLLRLASELLAAVACVHDHGLLHRDIKPSNVLIDVGGRSRLADFGLAVPEGVTDEQQLSEVAGTLRFLAPELIAGRPPTRQSDLYALGVLLRTAGRGDNPPAIAALISSLTARHPQHRPADARKAATFLR